MVIKSLSLKNFRNYKEEYFEFNEKINVLVGFNAQGKTNAVEAIFFLCTGYSPRANKDKQVIKVGEETAEIVGKAQSSYGEITVKIVFNKNDKKSIYINGLQVHKMGELFGNIKSVFFNPAELKLVQESPEDRRRFMNISLCQMSKSYFYALNRYNKILQQRNNLLKNPDKGIIKETLPVWDKQFAKEGAKIIFSRNAFLEELAPLAREKQKFLSGGVEDLEMKTESGYYGTEEEIYFAFLEDLKHQTERDLHFGYTTLGPHRDDIKFTLGGEDVRIFGSQGQQRTVALSLKLAETEMFKNKFGEYPILILDDVLSELDKKRKQRLIEAVKDMQTVFTTTEVSKTIFGKTPFEKIKIEKGAVKR